MKQMEDDERIVAEKLKAAESSRKPIQFFINPVYKLLEKSKWKQFVEILSLKMPCVVNEW